MTLPSAMRIEVPLLKEILAAGGEASPRDLYPRMRKYFPELTDEDVQRTLPSGNTNAWTNRIQWVRQQLVQTGELHREPRGVWRITPKGKERIRASEGSPIVDVAPSVPASPALEPTPPVTILTDEIDQLCDRLLKAQKQSSTPKNFEVALVDGFRYLGFDVKAQGRAGETDVLLDTYLGLDSYRAVVDAKATHGSKVADSQINWLAIHQHQQQAEAQHAAVVGIGFAGGNLLKWANEYQVALIRTPDLIEVIQMHRRAPFSLGDLRLLLSTPGPTQQSLQDLKLKHEGTIRHWHLLLDVVEQIDNYNRFNPRGLVATPDGIQLMLHTKILSQSGQAFDPSRVPSPDDVRDAMLFLASRAVGVLREAPPGSSSYHLTMHLAGAVQRIAALARELERFDLTGTSVQRQGLFGND
jgi:hypothetical protein